MHLRGSTIVKYTYRTVLCCRNSFTFGLAHPLQFTWVKHVSFPREKAQYATSSFGVCLVSLTRKPQVWNGTPSSSPASSHATLPSTFSLSAWARFSLGVT